jgi:IPT/TIG domain
MMRGFEGTIGRLARLTGLLVLAMGAAWSADASALILHVGTRTVSYQPPPSAASSQAQPNANQLMTYHGGPVMTSNTNYALYWAPAGAPEYPAGYEAGLNTYFADVAHDSGGSQTIDSVLAQYTQAEGGSAKYDSHFGGALIDTDPYPSNGCSSAPICLTDEQLRTELAKYIEAHALPADLAHEYFLLTPPGVESCLEAAGKKCSDGATHPNYCAYHSFMSLGKGVVIYAHDPYVNATNCDTGEEHPNGNASDATIGGGLAHEHSESVTDPMLSAWFDAKRREVADKCRTFKVSTEFGPPLGKAPNGSNYNQLINSDLYWYQQVWSNAAEACEQRQAALPVVTKVAPKTGPSSGGTSVTITGTGFAAPATVRFGAAQAAGATVNSATSITAVSPAGSAGTVDVTVTTESGTSAPVKKDHFKYKK